MKQLKKVLSIALIFAFIVQFGSYMGASASVNPPQPAPENLRAGSLGIDEADASSAKCYVDLQWDSLKSPQGMQTSVNKYINFYVQEITKPYRPLKPLLLKERDVSGSSTSLRMKGLTSGTIYYINSKAYYTYTENNSTYTSAESEVSNTIKILTDINIAAYSYSNNQIKIEWDDVWDSGRRMSYKLYVSENSTFANTSPIYISQDQIGPNGPVTVNEAAGKLEYIHTVRDPGRVYYVKIVPDTDQAELVKNPETKTVAVSSFIVVKTTKMSETDTGTIWRLEWRPVITGLTGEDIKISYQIDKYINNVPIPMLIEEGTSTFILVPRGEESTYYIIRAAVTRNDTPVYPGVKIESDRIVVKDQEIPSTPGAPELVDVLNNFYNEPVISYMDIFDQSGALVKKGELTPNSAAILWRVPKKADGSIDTDVVYDIWLISDPNNIDNPPDSNRIVTSMKPTQANSVMDGTRLIGYKYPVGNLTANSTYYFKIVAKKTFTEYVDEELQNVEYISQPALKVIITPPEGPIDQPLVPARPPLRIKKSLTNKDMVTDTTAVIQIKNKWYEQLVNTQWQYIRSEKLNERDIPPYDPYNPLTLPDGRNYRKVEYDQGVTIDVGCVKFVEGMTYNDLYDIPANKVRGFSVTANDPDEDPRLNAPEKKNPLVYKKHNVDITLSGLEPNTTYVVWVRAERASANLISGPSDPIIVTTSPVIITPVEKPVVPQFNYSQAGDTFADLGWDLKPGYNYYLKYGTLDDLSKASGSVSITSQELLQKSYYRVNGLKPNTLYYFWIQAEAVKGTQKIQSEWSDSYPVKTLQDIPPAAPKGFGIKSGEGMITKNSITFEWLKEPNLEYILEISGTPDYKETKEFKPGNASEFTVDGLLSNHRYYARLYAYDTVKKMKSQPTQSITVRTEKSSDEYDANEDVENVISGDYIIKDTNAVNGTWNIKITGVNADRFIEHVLKDNVLDYSIDLTEPPIRTDRISILVSSKVFDALAGLKENLMLETAGSQLIIRPGTMDKTLAASPFRRLASFDYKITIDSPQPSGYGYISLKTGVTEIAVDTCSGGTSAPLEQFGKPLKVKIPYEGNDWYTEGVTSGYVYDPGLNKWDKVYTTNNFDADSERGFISFEIGKPGGIAAADRGTDYFDDISGSIFRDAINNTASVHELKSVDGRMFEPDRYSTVSDAVKFMLDVMDYNYGTDYMSAAVKAGIISSGDAEYPDSSCTREKAIAMIVRLYELKTGEKAQVVNSDQTIFRDLYKVDPVLLPKIKFAIENGITLGRDSYFLEPKDIVTRGEIMGLSERLMLLVGELG